MPSRRSRQGRGAGGGEEAGTHTHLMSECRCSAVQASGQLPSLHLRATVRYSSRLANPTVTSPLADGSRHQHRRRHLRGEGARAPHLSGAAPQQRQGVPLHHQGERGRITGPAVGRRTRR